MAMEVPMRNRWVKAIAFALAGIVALFIAFGADALDQTAAKQAAASATKQSLKETRRCAG